MISIVNTTGQPQYGGPPFEYVDQGSLGSYQPVPLSASSTPGNWLVVIVYDTEENNVSGGGQVYPPTSLTTDAGESFTLQATNTAGNGFNEANLRESIFTLQTTLAATEINYVPPATPTHGGLNGIYGMLIYEVSGFGLSVVHVDNGYSSGVLPANSAVSTFNTPDYTASAEAFFCAGVSLMNWIYTFVTLNSVTPSGWVVNKSGSANPTYPGLVGLTFIGLGDQQAAVTLSNPMSVATSLVVLSSSTIVTITTTTGPGPSSGCINLIANLTGSCLGTIPGGTVTFLIDGTISVTVGLVSTGNGTAQATATVCGLSAGSHTYTVSYSGGGSGSCSPGTGGGGFYIGAGYLWQHGCNFTSFLPANASLFPYFYTRYGGLLKDESNLWSSVEGPNNGTYLGLSSVRSYCMAYGIFMSGPKDSQEPASSFLQTLCAIANAAAVWDGTGLDLVPYCEVSNYGNGTAYVAPTSSGPSFTLNWANFIPKQSGDPPLIKSLVRPKDNSNSIKADFIDPQEEYSPNQVIVADSADISANGFSQSSRSYQLLNSAAVATSVIWAELKRNLMVNRESYSTRLSACWGPILTPMDFVLLVDNPPSGPAISPWQMPARVTKIVENDDLTIDADFEPYIYGASAPTQPAGSAVTAGVASGAAIAGTPQSVNTPIIFESVPFIAPATAAQLWMVVSNSDPTYGGCGVYVSLDGGTTYQEIGSIQGNGVQGVVYSSNYPSHADPDTVDTLNVDLTQSNGTLSSFSSTAQNNFNSLCYLAGGGSVTINGVTLTIPYELVAYQAATLSSTSKYALGPPIRRGVGQTATPAHPIGSAFAFLNGGGLFKYSIPQQLIGVTLYFKFPAYNSVGSGQQPLSASTAYSFTPTGQVGWTANVAGTGDYATSAGTGVLPAANDISVYVAGTYTNGQELWAETPCRQTNIASSLVGTTASCDVAPTGAIVVTLKKNGTTIGTINFAASSTIPTFTFTTAQSFNGTTDELTFTAPAVADATFAGFRCTIQATRTN